MYVKAFIVNVNKCPKSFFLEQHINIVNRSTLQSFWFICSNELMHFPLVLMNRLNKTESTNSFHYSVDFIFLLFGITSFHCGTLKLLEGH